MSKFTFSHVKPSGWSAFTCSGCGGHVDVHPHEKTEEVEKEHTEADCAEEREALAELKAMQARHPSRAFARSLTGGPGKRWVLT